MSEKDSDLPIFNLSLSSPIKHLQTYNASNNTGLKRCLGGADILDIGSCRFIFEVYVVGILCLIGFVGNSLTIAALRRTTEKMNVTNWLLQMLSVFDLAFLAIALVVLPIKAIIWPQLRGRFTEVIVFFWPLIEIARFLTIWTVVLITAERYLAICRPMDVKWRRFKLVKLIVLLMFIVSVLLNIPQCFQWKTEPITSANGDNETLICATDLLLNPYYPYLYVTVCSIVFYSVGPFVILLVLNVYIILELKALGKKRCELTSGVKEERNISMMFVVVVAVFFICQIPQAVIEVIYKTSGVYFPFDVDFVALSCISDISEALVVLNSSINFFIYCLVWKKFNRILLSLLQCSEIENNNF